MSIASTYDVKENMSYHISLIVGYIHGFSRGIGLYFSKNTRDIIVFCWMVFWLYLSLGAVLTSFVAIQLQSDKPGAFKYTWLPIHQHEQNVHKYIELEKKADKSEAEKSEIEKLASSIKEIEGSAGYEKMRELLTLKFLADHICPWMPAFMLLMLPHSALILIVTLSMGALGGVLFMLQLHLVESGTSPLYKQSVSYHLFRPFQGMAAALAVLLFVKAGQLSISPPTSVGAPGSIDGDLNVFVLGLFGVISGLVSDRAIDRISAAGIALLSARSRT
jgi:hypothetical protein